MSKTFHKFNKYGDEYNVRGEKKIKTGMKNKRLRRIDNVLKTKDVSKIISLEEKF
jgi:hypothetical protein